MNYTYKYHVIRQRLQSLTSIMIMLGNDLRVYTCKINRQGELQRTNNQWFKRIACMARTRIQILNATDR